MRTYGQFCALARSLDVVGDRWTMLIIRELFARDSRYSDLREALTGIATNLLADRLRRLESQEVIESYEAPPPVRATVYRLTERGRALGPVLRSLVEWGMPLLDTGRGGDTFQPQWMMLALRVMYEEAVLDNVAPLSVVIRVGGEPVNLEISEDELTTSLGVPGSEPDVEIEGDPDGVYLLLSGGGTDESITLTGPGVDRLDALIDQMRGDGVQSQKPALRR